MRTQEASPPRLLIASGDDQAVDGGCAEGDADTGDPCEYGQVGDLAGAEQELGGDGQLGGAPDEVGDTDDQLGAEAVGGDTGDGQQEQKRDELAGEHEPQITGGAGGADDGEGEGGGDQAGGERRDAAEKAGLIRRIRGEEDRRRVDVELTEHGFELWTQAMGLRGDVEDVMVGVLTPADQDALSALLKKMLLQVERAPEAPRPIGRRRRGTPGRARVGTRRTGSRWPRSTGRASGRSASRSPSSPGG